MKEKRTLQNKIFLTLWIINSFLFAFWFYKIFLSYMFE